MANLGGELLLFAWAAAIVMVVPGHIVLALLPARMRPTRKFLWIYALSVGLAIHPLLYLLRDLLGLRASRLAPVWVIVTGLVALAAVQGKELRQRSWTLSKPDPRKLMVTLAIVGIFAGTFALRMWPLADDTVAPGTDAAGHAKHAISFIDAGGVPSEDFTYHFGVHGNTAAIVSVSGLPVHRVQLMLEPFLMAATAAGMVVLAWALTANMNIALATGVVTGFLSVFPAYFVVWGRLTMLGAVALMPVVLAEMIPQHSTRPDETSPVMHPVFWIVMAGLFVTHYRIAAMIFLAAAAWMVIRSFEEPSLRSVFAEAKRLAALLVPPALFVAPWIAGVLTRLPTNSDASFGTELTTGRYPPQFYDLAALRYLLDLPQTAPFLVLTAAGALWAAAFAYQRLAFIPVWLAIAFPFTDPYWLALPGAGVVYGPAYLGAAAIVGSVFTGIVIAGVAELAPAAVRKPWTIYAALVVAAGLSIGVGIDPLETRPYETYVRDADLAGYEWINEHVDPQATVLITTLVSNSGRPRAVDGGAWVDYFTGRSTRLGGGLSREQPRLQSRITAPESVEALVAAGVTHIYLGTLGYNVIDRSRLDSSENYRKVFSEGQAAIYEVVQ